MRFWHWLKENHPVLYEVIQWAILGMGIAAIVLNAVTIILMIIQKSY